MPTQSKDAPKLRQGTIIGIAPQGDAMQLTLKAPPDTIPREFTVFVSRANFAGIQAAEGEDLIARELLYNLDTDQVQFIASASDGRRCEMCGEPIPEARVEATCSNKCAAYLGVMKRARARKGRTGRKSR